MDFFSVSLLLTYFFLNIVFSYDNDDDEDGFSFVVLCVEHNKTKKWNKTKNLSSFGSDQLLFFDILDYNICGLVK